MHVCCIIYIMFNQIFMRIFSLYISILLLAFSTTVHAQENKKELYSSTLTEAYACMDAVQSPKVANKPLIGISLGYNPKKNSVNTVYVQSVLKNGGVPYLVPVTDDVETLRQIVAQLDGLVMTGGEDINPKFYGEENHPELGEVNHERDSYDLTLVKLAIEHNVPILGICRGLQLINVAMGGTLYQDLPSQHSQQINHRQESGTILAHKVLVTPDTQTSKVLGVGELMTNSLHHQAIKKLAPGLKITGKAEDGVVEMVEGYPTRPILAVQYHPEYFASEGDTLMSKFFRHLINKADTFQLAKDIHSRILSVDTHTDTPLWFRSGYSVGLRKNNAVSVQKMNEGKLDAQFLAAFLSQKERDDASLQKAVEKCQGLIRNIYADVEKYKDACGIALTEDDAWELKKQGKKAFFIGIENGYGIGKDLKNILKFKNMGVNYITLCHSYDNDICHSSTNTEDASKGLTAFGREVVKEMNRVSMIIDLSHANEATFWDVIKLSTDPIIASHSGAKACCSHNRNLTDEQLRALAKNGGVVQVCIYKSYLNKNKNLASVDDVIRHIDHIVKVAGIDHVGIGSDFDGGGGVAGCMGDNDMINITVRLIERGYSEEDIRKIWGGNFFRVMNQVQR